LVGLQAKDIGHELGIRVAWILLLLFGFDGLNPRPHLCALSMILSYNFIDPQGSVFDEFVDNIQQARALSEYVFATCAAYALKSPSLLEVSVMLVQIVTLVATL
jgi:hypothetical protein